MKLVIAEKPSVAMAIGKVLGCTVMKDGYLEGCGAPVENPGGGTTSEARTKPGGKTGYIVSWCVGHLIELANPEYYDEKYKKWRKEDLPK